MSIEGGAQFSGEGFGGGVPAQADIQMEDCTLVLIAVNKRLGEAHIELNDRIVAKSPVSTEYDCKACFAKLIDAGFSNVQGSLSCHSQWRAESESAISEA